MSTQIDRSYGVRTVTAGVGPHRRSRMPRLAQKDETIMEMSARSARHGHRVIAVPRPLSPEHRLGLCHMGDDAVTSIAQICLYDDDGAAGV